MTVSCVMVFGKWWDPVLNNWTLAQSNFCFCSNLNWWSFLSLVKLLKLDLGWL